MGGTRVKLKKIGDLLKTAWLIAGITVLLFCLLEGGLSLAYRVKSHFRRHAPSAIDDRIDADAYAGSPWVARFYAEDQRSSSTHWMPYVYWRRRPFHGDYINVDANGIRLTTPAKPPQGESRGPVRIFMLGGSTLWGTGVRDAFTIPSIVARELQKTAIAPDITNFGETGYVSTQEVITLLLRLRQGDIPDLVIFYDGVNDTYSAYQQRVAGLPQNEFKRVTEYLLAEPGGFKRGLSILLRPEVQELSTVRFLKGLLWRAGVWRDAQPGADSMSRASAAAVDESLAQEVLRSYRGNLEAVSALSEHYGFKCLFYWQPTIFQKRNLTTYERKRKGWLEPLEPFFRRTDELMRQTPFAAKGGSQFHNLSLIFADVQEPVYIDWCHLGEAGNEIVAKRMVTDILETIAGSKRLAEGSVPGGDASPVERSR
jgi:hypothetical protein